MRVGDKFESSKAEGEVMKVEADGSVYIRWFSCVDTTGAFHVDYEPGEAIECPYGEPAKKVAK